MYIIATIEDPFNYDTMHEGSLCYIQQEGEEAEQTHEQEEGEKEAERN